MSDLHRRSSLQFKKVLAPILFRHLCAGLGPARLRLYLNAIFDTRSVPGAVVEVGCNVGGTAITAHKFLRQIGSPRDYYCLDTFQGFVLEQYERDAQMGNTLAKARAFSANDIALVRRILKLHGRGHQARPMLRV